MYDFNDIRAEQWYVGGVGANSPTNRWKGHEPVALQ